MVQENLYCLICNAICLLSNDEINASTERADHKLSLREHKPDQSTKECRGSSKRTFAWYDADSHNRATDVTQTVKGCLDEDGVVHASNKLVTAEQILAARTSWPFASTLS